MLHTICQSTRGPLWVTSALTLEALSACGPDGNPVLHKLNVNSIVEEEHGWYRFEYLPAREYNSFAHGDWQKAWHACKFEGLYSILYSGALRGSLSEDRGERLLHGAPGVYVHSDATKAKATVVIFPIALVRFLNQ